MDHPQRRDADRPRGQALRGMDYDTMEQPSAPRRGTSDSDGGGVGGVGELNAEELIQVDKSSTTGSGEIAAAMTAASTSDKRDQHDRDAKNFRSNSGTLPTFLQSDPRTGDEINTNNYGNAKSMAVEREPRLDHRNVADAGAFATIGDDDELSTDLSMPRLMRAPQRTATSQFDSELLHPSQRVVKVQPEAGCPQPGAYAARQSRMFANESPANSDNHTYSAPEDSQDPATNSTSDLHVSSRNDEMSNGTFTMASLGDRQQQSTQIRQSSSLHVEESFGSQGSGYLKSNSRRRLFIFAGVVALILEE